MFASSLHRPGHLVHLKRALGAALPVFFLACGGEDPKPIPVTQIPVGDAKVIPAGGLPPTTTKPTEPAKPLVVTFEDAESIYKSGDYAKAKERFVDYVATKPENAFGHYMLGLSSWKSGDLAGAEKAFDKAIELDSTHVKSYLNSARVFLDQGRDHEAIERVLVALDLDSVSAEGFRLLARAQHRLGDVGAALDTYRHALVVNEKDTWTMNNLGVLYIEEGDPESALPPLARAVELRSTAPVFQNNFGTALERAGFLGAAKRAYQAALDADPSYAKARTSLTRVTEILEKDPSKDIVVNAPELAQLFRMHIQMWRDTEVKPVVEEPEPEIESEPVATPPAPSLDTVTTVVPVARDTASCPGC
ncbi:MAG: tetratricopeptide repeat protein [Gemmatimonadales bacterium]